MISPDLLCSVDLLSSVSFLSTDGVLDMVPQNMAPWHSKKTSETRKPTPLPFSLIEAQDSPARGALPVPRGQEHLVSRDPQTQEESGQTGLAISPRSLP